MFETVPKGEHTTSTCARTSRARCSAPTRSTRRCRTPPATTRSFNVRAFECLGACDIAPMASVDGEYVGPLDRGRLPARSSTTSRPGGRRARDKQLAAPQAAAETAGEPSRHDSSSSRTSTSPACNTLDVYQRGAAATRCSRKALKMEPGDVLAELHASGVRGRGGAGFAMGTKMSFLPKGDDGQVPRLQRRRVRARAPSRTAS